MSDAHPLLTVLW